LKVETTSKLRKQLETCYPSADMWCSHPPRYSQQHLFIFQPWGMFTQILVFLRVWVRSLYRTDRRRGKK